jgi:tetratricopeptide (TPR) repeat protein/ABC-type branched-subunit amino acid transport system ATPase component
MIEKILNDRYRLESELGQGGMGTVYRAHDSVLDRDVALKLMSSPRLGTEGLSRLLVEAQTIAKLKHPNIVTVYDAGKVENQPYVVMEYIQGDTLNEHELDGFVEIVQVARQICAALLYAHEQNIIHRDLKPENVIIEPDGTVRLMDFGLAISTASRMTEKGLIMGTVYYMSPEQAFGREITPQSDLYSLGVILYELTTKRLPFEAEDALAVITQHIHAPVVPPRAKNEHIPVLLNDLILALLSKEPGDRPKSAKDVLAVLEDTQILAGDDSSVRELAVLDRIVRGRIVGRETEFQEARSLWQKTTTGQGQVLLISGEPGIGKTRLMREIVTHAEVSGGTALLGECYAESNAPYSAFSQIVRRGLSSRAANEIAFPDAVLADLLKLTPDLRLQYSNLESNPQLDPESEQQRLFEHMVAFCKTLAEKSPLLLVVDDVHWADSGTLAMLHHLIRRIGKQYVMILVTYREVELRESRPFNDMLLELNRQRQGTRLKLDRLDREANHEMLQSIFAMEVSSEFSDSIYRETDGNPFFIEEVCRALVESGALYYEDGEWHRPSMEELEIPQGIQIAVESRLSKLPKEHLEALRMAAILGREFEFDVLLEALDMDEDALIEALEAAEEAQMIQEADGTGDVAFVFVHALVPNAIVESVRTLRRRRLHKQAAKAIEELTPQNYEALAYHYGEAGDEGKTIKFHIMAGDRAAAAYANQDAEEHFLAALDLVVGEQEEADLLTKTGISQDNQGKFNSAIETWGQAIRLYQVLGDIDKAAELYARSGRALLSNGDTKAGLKNCHQGLSFTEGAPDGPGLARLLAETGRACHFNGLPEESRRYSQEALLMSERLDLTSVQIESLISLGLLMNQTIDQSVKLFN